MQQSRDLEVCDGVLRVGRDNYAINLAAEATIPAIRTALADALDRMAEGEDMFAPFVDDRALDAVKFGDMVPEHMLRAEVAQR